MQYIHGASKNNDGGGCYGNSALNVVLKVLRVGPIVPLTVRYSPSSEVQTSPFTWAATNEPNFSSIFLLSENVEKY